MTRHTISTIEQTKQLAIHLGKQATIGDVFLLSGDLGAGKSSFARFFIQSIFNQEITVPSPTFTLLQEYDSPLGTIYHYDLYRIECTEEIYELGFEENCAQGISLIEWPEKIMNIPMKNPQVLQFHHQDQQRWINIYSSLEGFMQKID